MILYALCSIEKVDGLKDGWYIVLDPKFTVDNDNLFFKNGMFYDRRESAYPVNMKDVYFKQFTHYLRPTTITELTREKAQEVWQAGWRRGRAEIGDTAGLTDEPTIETYLDNLKLM